MKTDIRFMNEVFRIVSGALRLDIDKVRNYTAYLADKLETSGDKTAADRLRVLLAENDHALRPAKLGLARTLPVDSESRFPLVERINIRTATEPALILSQESWDLVNEFLSIAKSHAQFESDGLFNTLSLILYGPPGTGKSRLARYVAKELGLDLYLARLDGLISSYLGSTSKNIRAIFEFASRAPCILFLDEFDAIAKLREDSQELGELKRVVNSFIQNLDSLGSQTIVIAATNHPELLDKAIWRRFTYRLEFQYPNLLERAEMWKGLAPRNDFNDKDINMLADLSEGFTGSDIREVAVRLYRRSLASGSVPSVADAFTALKNLSLGEGQDRRFLSRFAQMSDEQISSFLRDRDSKLYSLSAIARLLGVSKATAFRLKSLEESNE